jgi:hypothetical protein
VTATIHNLFLAGDFCRSPIDVVLIGVRSPAASTLPRRSGVVTGSAARLRSGAADLSIHTPDGPGGGGDTGHIRGGSDQPMSEIERLQGLIREWVDGADAELRPALEWQFLGGPKYFRPSMRIPTKSPGRSEMMSPGITR